MNGGNLIPPTFRKRSEQEALALATRVIKPETSEKMRYLMRLNVEKGTGKPGPSEGLLCGRQDRHTSEKVVAGAMKPSYRPTSPRYPAYLLADHARRARVSRERTWLREPSEETKPVAGRRRGFIARIAPSSGIEPRSTSSACLGER